MSPDEKQRIIDEAVALEHDRLWRITASSDGQAFQALAHFMAFDTRIAADDAVAILAIARVAIDAAAAASEPEAWARANVSPEISIHSH